MKTNPLFLINGIIVWVEVLVLFIKELMVILIDNAIKYCNKSRNVIITLNANGNYIRG